MNARRIGECKGHRDQAIDSSCHRVRACCACGCRRRCALCKAHSPLEQRTDRRYNGIRRRQRRGLWRRLSALSRSGSVGVDLHSEPKYSLAGNGYTVRHCWRKLETQCDGQSQVAHVFQQKRGEINLQPRLPCSDACALAHRATQQLLTVAVTLTLRSESEQRTAERTV